MSLAQGRISVTSSLCYNTELSLHTDVKDWGEWDLWSLVVLALQWL